MRSCALAAIFTTLPAIQIQGVLDHIREQHAKPKQKEITMRNEDDYRDRPCGRGMCRRDFLKLTVAAGLLAGCRAIQKPTPTPTSEPTATPTITPTPRPTAIPTYSVEDFTQMSYCGIRCRVACPEGLYPTQCESCKSTGEKVSAFSKECEIRKCASEKQVLTCAHCDDYPSCEAKTWATFPSLRGKIDQIRKYLGKS
jgi:hypothetical protein